MNGQVSHHARVMLQEEPTLDLSLIDFPSNRLPLKTLRKCFRTMQDIRQEPGDPSLVQVHVMVCLEEEIAEDVFRRALAKPPLTGGKLASREDYLGSLDYHYGVC